MSDLIERDKAINILDVIDVDIIPYADTREYVMSAIDYIRKELEDIPSARPKEGKWLEAGRMTQFNRFYYFRYCSKCFYARDDCDSEKDTNFCPNCGCAMKGADDEYERAVEQMEYDMLYEPTYNPEDGSM